MVGETTLLEIPDAGDLFAVELMESCDRLAPLAGSEGERKGFAAVDGRELDM